MNFNQQFKLNKFFGQLEIFQCSFCLDVCKDPVIDRKNQQIVCMKHSNRTFQQKKGILLNYLYQQVKMSCQYCSKEKYYYSYHRHTSKCYERQIDPNFILNFFNFINEYDQDNVICQLCKKFTAELLICSSCKTNKCLNCKICNKNSCSECILEVAQQNQNIQLQCKAEFCREIVKVENTFSHYQICNYRMKKCRTKLCNWEGYKMYYQDHECQNKIEFHSNQTHSIKYAQMLDIKEYRKVSQLQQKTIMKIKLLNQRLQNFDQI